MPNNSLRPDRVLSWDDLLESIENGLHHPESTSWHIFNYLTANYMTMDSKLVRTLLLAFLKIRSDRPSLINSCILSFAVDISSYFNDFNFPRFLEAWGYKKMLRPEDCLKPNGSGLGYELSLCEKVEKALERYELTHVEKGKPGFHKRVYWAVKLFEKLIDGHVTRSVKLVDSLGRSIFADARMFAEKPKFIQGHLYDAVTYSSPERPDFEILKEISLSSKFITDLFDYEVGYVDCFKIHNRHYHIFDSLSRHFVAENPDIDILPSDYVLFCPIIPIKDKFKSAVVLRKLDRNDAMRQFGLTEAVIRSVDTHKCVLTYELVKEPVSTPEGFVSKQGTIPVSVVRNVSSADDILVGRHIGLVIFLKRNTDFVKVNFVPDAVLL